MAAKNAEKTGKSTVKSAKNTGKPEKKKVRTMKDVVKEAKKKLKAEKNMPVTYETIPEQLGYIEPEDYFPEEIRKKYGLGEYYDVGPSKKKFRKK